MFEIKKILVPIDFSECSKAALDRALSLAEKVGAKVTLCHVAEISPAISGLQLSAQGGGATLGEHVLATARNELESFMRGVTLPSDARPEVRLVVGRPREAILQEARIGKYDLLVMGTHGRTGRVHELAGSVTESVVRAADCAVMTVRCTG